jgi:hypothetical protein
MRFRRLLIALAAATALGVLTNAEAQINTATLNGIVSDESKGILPGATVTATDLETGRKYVSVSDNRGNYQIALLPPGLYRLQAELQGFATAEVPRAELLVGQNTTINFTMKLAGVQENVTVTGETPLVDVSSSQIAGNVDRRQMEAMPLQGRNWLELSLLVKGVTTNNVTNNPGVSANNESFQLNLDGQQIKQNDISAGAGEPHFSREAIAEFQIVTNLFDVTQGRSAGVQVQAISKSGTNTMSGVAYGYFRNDKFNAADPVANKVLPYSNQQAGGAFGGPVVKDKIHYFVSYEYERQPATIFSQPPELGGASFTTSSIARQNSYLGRGDWQLSARNNLTVRASHWDFNNPFSLDGVTNPSRAGNLSQNDTAVVATWSQVISNTRVSEVRVGYLQFLSSNYARPELEGFPDYVFPGSNGFGRPYNLPYAEGTHTYQFRYDQAWNRSKHSIKFGGEFLKVHDEGLFYVQKYGRMFFTSLPSPADMARRFPIDQWNNPAAWNLAGLDSIVQRFDINYDPGRGDIPPWTYDIPRPTFAAWFGDNWRPHPKLTINYGVRWDDDWGEMAPPAVVESTILINNGKESGDFGYKQNIHDHLDFAPRVGFVYNVGGANDFVVRGGTGLYYATPVSNVVYSQQLYNRYVSVSFVNDGQPGFSTNPTRGVTENDVLSGKVPVPPQTKRIMDPGNRMPFTWQSSIGFQKQLGSVMAIESDLTGWHWYRDTRTHDPNLFFDPTTGYNIDPKFGRPNPNYGQIAWFTTDGQRDYLGLSTGFTRRFKNNFQGGLTHTLMFYMRDDGTIGYTTSASNNEFDRNGEWTRSTDFQRNTVRLWGVYEFRGGLSISGAYFFGSGNYYGDTVPGSPYGKPGTNRLNLGAPITIPATIVDRWNGPAVIATGSVAPRNALQGTPLHKVDVRVQEEVRLPGKTRLQLVGEIFNLFNHDNFGTFVTLVSNASFGQPRQNLNNAYVPRSGQLGFRLSF